eukprot:CAMPEP_0183728290 /NCGR_PEP_ID=MMETSP0737-20130205/27663_1 /TAXON_ID=385413 /ORGANISM="Thalassiosira miniscula, Strain CCMP1093" /LENGTH=168 /DNA_ID=CAMNT_0025960183 /DNA_START=135 /DNA_END=641 /DNA_ORIENTATION=-
MNSFLIAFDQLFAGFTISITIWHFFLQAPTLMKLLGKEKFVPLMMQLTRLWVKTVFVSSSALLITAMWLSYNYQAIIVPTMKFHWVGIGWLSIFINRYVIVPRALKAGARSVQQRKGDGSKDFIQDFVVEGGGKNETKALHQTVVLFVLIMVGSFFGHLVDLAAVMVL